MSSNMTHNRLLQALGSPGRKGGERQNVSSHWAAETNYGPGNIDRKEGGPARYNGGRERFIRR